MKEEKDRTEVIKKASEKIIEQNEIEKMEELLKNNFIPFKIGEVEYRVRKPNYNERTEARTSRTKKYIKLLKDKDWVLRDELVKLYLTKGIDIKDIERTIKKYTYKIEENQKKLATTTDKVGIEAFENEIKFLEDEQKKLINKKAELLEYCIEEELSEYSNLFLLYSVLEIKKEDKWERLFKSFDDLMSSDNEGMIIEGAGSLALLLFRPVI